MPVYAELVKDYPVQYVAGGATLNSIRVAKWMMQQEGSAAYMGCISTDEFGCTMEASLAREARRMRARPIATVPPLGKRRGRSV